MKYGKQTGAIFLFLLFSSAGAWTWDVIILNNTINPKAALSVVDEYIYPFPAQKKVFVRAQGIQLDQLRLPPQNIEPPALGRRIRIWATHPGSGAAIKSNEIIITKDIRLVSEDEINKSFIFLREPAGHYQIKWDNNYNLIATQEDGYARALNLFKGAPSRGIYNK